MILLEHMLDATRVQDHVVGPDKEANTYDITVLVHHGHVKAYGIALDITHTPKQRAIVWTRWHLLARRCSCSEGFGCGLRHLFLSFIIIFTFHFPFLYLIPVSSP